jgi:hypothetical protein
MATSTATIALLQTTDAEFRTWVAAFITNCTAVGLVQTADTGQINTSTVLKPAGASTAQGYAMFKFDDGLTDFYIKFEFGGGTDGASQPAIWHTTGWATDGAGTLTGSQISERFRHSFTLGNNGYTGDVDFCFDDGCFNMVFNNARVGSNPATHGLMFERFRTAGTGAPNALGAHVFVICQTYDIRYGAGPTQIKRTVQSVPASGGTPSVVVGTSSDNRLPIAHPDSTGSWSDGSNLGLAPLVPWAGGGFVSTIGVVFGSSVDFPTVSATASVSMYGTSRTYKRSAITSDPSANGRALFLFQ